MAERRAINKYYPPDWEPSKGSINTYRNSHPLRERAKMLKSDGVLVVRFEMPFDVSCLNCDTMIGRGTRFNAEKVSTGKYHSSTIWQFSMKCASCAQSIVVVADPEKRDYIVKSGARRRSEWAPEEGDNYKVMAAETASDLASDPMKQKEYLQMDQNNFGATSSLSEDLKKLCNIQNNNWKDDYARGAELRKIHRETRRGIQAEKESFNRVYGETLAEDINLLPDHQPEDVEEASETVFRNLSKKTATKNNSKTKLKKVGKMINSLRKRNGSAAAQTTSKKDSDPLQDLRIKKIRATNDIRIEKPSRKIGSGGSKTDERKESGGLEFIAQAYL